jgi:hypothetical protein
MGCELDDERCDEFDAPMRAGKLLCINGNIAGA